jgi:hypothetical protein
VEVRKPTWTSASFLFYTGGLVVLASALGALAYLSTQYGRGALVAWTLLPLVVLSAVANALRNGGSWIAAGVFAFSAVTVWGVLWGELFAWWGWTPSATHGPFDGFNWSVWLIALLVLVAVQAAIARFRFPLLAVYVIAAVYYIVTDIVSNGGNWTAVVTLVFGFALGLRGVAIDGGTLKPFGFWYHTAAAVLIGGALLFWWHSSELDWALLAAASVVYVGIAASTRRSIWALLGVAGIVAAATHWTAEWTATPFLSELGTPRFWVPPLVFGVVGFFIVVLGLLAARRERPAVS